MELPPDGSKENCFQKTKNFIEQLNCGVDGDAIDRAHRLSPVTENEEGKKLQQIIVRFKPLKDCTTVYKNRKKAENGARIRLDLTKRRLAMLLAVRKLNRPEVDYVFADITCNLAAKLRNGKFVFFTSVDTLLTELDKAK